MAALRNTRPIFSQIEGVDYRRDFRTSCEIHLHQEYHFHTSRDGLENSPDGCEDRAFLNGFIDEEVYIEQPQGFEVSDRETHMCLLIKALYGLKQAP
jgi:hypothetical protein